MTVTFEWIIYIVVQRNSLPRHPSTIPRTSKLDSNEHILRAEAVGTPSSSILESFEQSIWAEYPRVHWAHPARVFWVLTMENRLNYAVQPLICDGLFRPRRSAPVKLECAGLCTNWGECYRSLRGLLVVVSIGLVFNVELSLNKH